MDAVGKGNCRVMGTPVQPPPPAPGHGNSHAAAGSGTVPIQRVAGAGTGFPSYPYVHFTPDTTVESSSGGASSAKNSPMDTILKVLGRVGRTMEDSARQATDVTANVWHHLKAGPSITDAAMSRLAQGTKVFAEGGNDKVFQQTFGILPGEQLRKTYACYFSTSSGPVIGTLYLSTARLAFCSDNPLSHALSNGLQELTYYKVVIPLHQLRAVNPSASVWNPAERYIQIVTTDNHEFWFLGFVSYQKALMNLMEVVVPQANN